MRVTVAERIKALKPVQAREYFTWRDAGLSMEAALGRVENTERVTVQESEDGSEFDHLFTRAVRESGESSIAEVRASLTAARARAAELEAQLTGGSSGAEVSEAATSDGAEFDHLFSSAAR